MELRHLRTFVIVAETLNISEAARRLRVTQPALSRHIQCLEHAVGQPLFHRAPGKLLLTATGLTLRDHGEKALAAVDDALRNARGVDENESVIRVGYYGSVSIWASILAPALERLGRSFPKVTSNVSEVTSAKAVIELREGRLDVAFLGPGSYPNIPGVAIEVACTVPGLAMMAANHQFAKKRSISIEELRDEEIVGVTPEVAPGRDRALITACRAAGFSPRIASVASSLPEIIMAVKKRNGVAILGSLAKTVPHPGMVFVPLKSPGVPLELYTAHAEHAAPVACQLAKLITGEAQRLALRG